MNRKGSVGAVLLWVVGGIVAVGIIAGFWLMGSYNSMVAQSQSVDNSWAQVESQYQRRFDLVPNLVAATEGAMSQEKAVFGAIADARTKYAGAPAGSDAKVQATAQYDSALSRLLVVMENYPVLKSIDSIRTLTDELAGTENRILVSRNNYNATVQDWNTSIKIFPRSMVAGMFGFHTREFFASDAGANQVPKVKL